MDIIIVCIDEHTKEYRTHLTSDESNRFFLLPAISDYIEYKSLPLRDQIKLRTYQYTYNKVGSQLLEKDTDEIEKNINQWLDYYDDADTQIYKIDNEDGTYSIWMEQQRYLITGTTKSALSISKLKEQNNLCVVGPIDGKDALAIIVLPE